MRPVVPRPVHVYPSRFAQTVLTVAATSAFAFGGTSASAAGAAPTPTGGVSPAIAQPEAKTTSKSRANAKAKSRSKAKTRKRAKAKARAQSTGAFISDYTGPTGAIFHRRHSVGGPVRGGSPSRYEEEAWFEIEGGRRTHRISTYGPIAGSGDSLSSGSNENWSTPDFEVNLERGTVYSPHTPGSFARLACPTQREAFRGSHGDLALWEWGRVQRIYDRYVAGEQLPAGPTIDGHETITGEIRQSADFSQTLYIDRLTGALRRIVNHDRWNGDVPIDYSVWEMIPAGGSAANLSGTLPASGVEIRSPEDCAQIAPFPVGTP